MINNNEPQNGAELTDEMLTSYVEGLLPDADRQRVERFISQNVFLHEEVEALKSVYQAQQAEGLNVVPDDITERTQKILGEYFQTDVLKIVVSWADNIFRVIKSTGVLLVDPQAAVKHALRDSVAKRNAAAVLQKDFHRARLIVELFPQGDAAMTATVILKNFQGQLVQTILRITLKDPQGELESQDVSSGYAEFANIKPGEYQIDIADSGRRIGMISLQINHL